MPSAPEYRRGSVRLRAAGDLAGAVRPRRHLAGVLSAAVARVSRIVCRDWSTAPPGRRSVRRACGCCSAGFFASMLGIVLGATIGSSRVGARISRADARIRAAAAGFGHHSGRDPVLRPVQSHVGRRDRIRRDLAGAAVERLRLQFDPGPAAGSLGRARLQPRRIICARSPFRRRRRTSCRACASVSRSRSFWRSLPRCRRRLPGIGRDIFMAQRSFRSADLYAGLILLGVDRLCGQLRAADVREDALLRWRTPIFLRGPVVVAYFVGTDVGGTFTDLWVSESSGRTRVFKTPTTKDVLSGVIDAVEHRGGCLRTVFERVLRTDRTLRTWHDGRPQCAADRPGRQEPRS